MAGPLHWDQPTFILNMQVGLTTFAHVATWLTANPSRLAICGMHHFCQSEVPMLGHLALYWVPSARKRRVGVTMHQRNLGRQASIDGSPEWHQFLQHSGSLIVDGLCVAAHSVDSRLKQLHSEIISLFGRSFSASKPSPPPAIWQTTTSIAHTLWYHRKCLRLITAVTWRTVLQAWHHMARYAALKRHHRRVSHQLRTQRFEDTLQQANLSADRHDMHNMFRVLTRNSPKTPYKRMQLRDDAGCILTPIEEHATLVAFVRNTWDGDPLDHMYSADAPGVPFTVRDLAVALSRIPVVKSMAPICAPGLIWRAHAFEIAPVLHQLLRVWWAQSPPIIPWSWRAGWLHMIPKPSKRPNKPQHLRPLAL